MDFFQKFYENADSLYTSVTKHKTLEEFIKSAGYELVQIKNEETNEHMFSAFTKFRPRTQFSSVHGLYYMITFENKVYLNESTLQYLKDKYTLVHT